MQWNVEAGSDGQSRVTYGFKEYRNKLLAVQDKQFNWLTQENAVLSSGSLAYLSCNMTWPKRGAWGSTATAHDLNWCALLIILKKNCQYNRQVAPKNWEWAHKLACRALIRKRKCFFAVFRQKMHIKNIKTATVVPITDKFRCQVWICNSQVSDVPPSWTFY